MSWSRARWTLAGVGAVVALVLVGAAAGLWYDAFGGGPKAQESATVAPVSTPARTSGEVEYLDQLAGLNPGLVVNEDRALRRAQETCADIADGWRGEALYQRVAQRLSGGDATVDRDDAAIVVALMQRTVC